MTSISEQTSLTLSLPPWPLEAGSTQQGITSEHASTLVSSMLENSMVQAVSSIVCTSFSCDQPRVTPSLIAFLACSYRSLPYSIWPFSRVSFGMTFYTSISPLSSANWPKFWTIPNEQCAKKLLMPGKKWIFISSSFG